MFINQQGEGEQEPRFVEFADLRSANNINAPEIISSKLPAHVKSLNTAQWEEMCPMTFSQWEPTTAYL